MNITAKPLLALQLANLVQNLALHDHVECRRGLIQDHQRGLERKRQRDTYALPHAARELVGIGIDTIGLDVHHLEQMHRPITRRLPGLRAMRDERVLDLLTDRDHGVQCIHGALENDRDLVPAELSHLFDRDPQQIRPSNTACPRR